MLCAISGEAPQVAVVSRKSGHLFEKRLIEAHIKEHHTDPVTGEDLEVDDLLELKSARTLKPRPPTLTSIPALLSAFQNEWDAIALETYNLRQELAQTRQELSTALYQHDAATRVIARLVKERDEAREALSTVTVSAGSGASNGDAMQVDGQALSEELAALVTKTQEQLSSTRKKRQVPEDWATAEDIQSLESIKSTDAFPGSQALAVERSRDLVLVGGSEGTAGLYTLSQLELIQPVQTTGQITAAVWWDNRPVIATSTGEIKIYSGGDVIGQLKSHAGAVTGLSLHASGYILASTGVDKSIVFHNISDLKTASQIFTDTEITCGAFHPDGHLFGAGGRDGQVRLFDVITGSLAAEFKAEGALQTLVFSENGYWLASASKDQNSVTIWDLRKQNAAKVIDIGSPVSSIDWDFTGQFVAVAGPGCVTVQQYSKAGKSWSEPFRKAVPAKGVRWGPKGKSLVTLTAEDGLNVFGAS